MAVSDADVRHVAALARLAIPEQRVPALVRELNGILEHMAVLETVDVSTLAEDARTAMPRRDDVVAPVPLVRPLAEFAPAPRDGFLLVPRLSTHSQLGASEGDE
ncbi:MAG TPA: Asp-tRNA(Asn)/Glu-tRNA(Gln) amidotransferase subunit GatC [Gemmatimonadaceae bacterium]|nr:Asp-tRNA(Asn)/Glu-tRNA(Gln) amidotransferase subunit GatC [Gemmatimonadaceae bacterium]